MVHRVRSAVPPWIATIRGPRPTTSKPIVVPSAERTSPYAFYQFWVNSDDADVPKFLRTYTFFSHDELLQLEAEHRANRARAPRTARWRNT